MGLLVEGDTLYAVGDGALRRFQLGPDGRAVGKPAEGSKVKNVASRFRHTVEWVRIQNDTVYVRSEVDRIAAAVAEEVLDSLSPDDILAEDVLEAD